MLTTIEVPKIAPRQKIADFKKAYVAATATLKDAEKRSCLPLYVCRTQGEKNLAHAAAAKETLDAAFKYLEELIDGAPCQYAESVKFFELSLGGSATMDSIRSYYFELHEISVRAGMPTNAFAMRFLSNIPGGKKFYDSFKDSIKLNMTSDEVTKLFKDMLPKLKKRFEEDDVESPKVAKEEQFVFPVQQETEQRIPHWGMELKNQLTEIRSRMESNESGFGDEFVEEEGPEAFAFKKFSDGKGKGKSRVICYGCKQPGHFLRDCKERGKCKKCNGYGHSAYVCPSSGPGGSRAGGKR